MDDEFSLLPIGFRIHPPDQTIAPKYRKNEIAIFSFVSPNINLHGVIKIKEPLQSLALDGQIVERGQKADNVFVQRRIEFERLGERKEGSFRKIGGAELDGLSPIHER